ncbi:hypothetical protein L6164_026209 [Bauhinia variegata]|uniref:Uncharacterized protein n=1 Tax=Bauhinia variegata TaxID=167791 RepID=A0ACB9LPN3_BAUVA|nr:hypothetical protein L6164_026209 [Bauhinia variegata]
MHDEIMALKKNGTWSMVKLPLEKKACKWVYKIKGKSNGTIERHKTRLDTFGNHQVEGINLIETFTPVAKKACYHFKFSEGPMDMHIELSYCDFEGFKVELAKNYLIIG